METFGYFLICCLILGVLFLFLKLAGGKPKRTVEVSYQTDELYITTGDGQRLTIRGDFTVSGEKQT